MVYGTYQPPPPPPSTMAFANSIEAQMLSTQQEIERLQKQLAQSSVGGLGAGQFPAVQSSASQPAASFTGPTTQSFPASGTAADRISSAFDFM
jgi:hypothetical protein